MSTDKLLAEWFWIDRWDGSTAVLLGLEARGLYREMLTQAWRRGARLPVDEQAIQRAVRCTAEEWARCWPLVRPYWRQDGDFLVNDTQLEVYADAKARSEAASERGRRGGRASGRARSINKVQHELDLGSTQVPPERKPPSPSPITNTVPSEQGANAPVVGDPFAPSPTSTANGNGRSDWPTRAAAMYLTFYPKAQVPKPMFKALKPLVSKHGTEAVEAELDAYLRGTEVQYHNWSKFAAGFGSWAVPSTAIAARASPGSKGAMGRSEDAVMRFVARVEADGD